MNFRPRKIYIDSEVENHPVTQRIITNPLLDGVERQVIDEMSKIGDLIDGNALILKKESAFITEEFRARNLTNMEVFRSQGGRVLSLNLGKDNDNVVIINVNTDDMMNQMKNFADQSYYPILFNAGEKTDSLALEALTELSTDLVPFIHTLPNAMMEMRTKTASVNNLEELDHKGKTIIAFSLSPQLIIDQIEEDTAIPFEQRLEAIVKCQQWGYPVSLKLDPVIPLEGWQDAYAGMITQIKENVKPHLLHHYAVGILQMDGKLMEIAKKKNPDSLIWSLDLSTLLDKKHTLPESTRIEVYNLILNCFQPEYVKIPFYLSMEERKISDAVTTERKIDVKVAMLQTDDLSARRALWDTDDELSSTNWSNVFTTSIFQCKSEKSTGQPVRIVASIYSITDSHPINIDKQNKRVTVCGITLQDKYGEEIECFKFPVDSFPNIFKHFEKHVYCVFCGTVISIIEEKNATYKFFLKSIIDRVTAEDLIMPRPTGGERIAEIFKQNAQSSGGIVRWIKSTLVRELDIRALNEAAELDKCIDFMIYQSFSAGRDQNKSMKLHSLVIGSPGVGKKLLTIIAKVLNPAFQEVAALDGKVTLAGLIGDVKSKNGRRISNPGYFAKASPGVLSIQDFHNVTGTDRKKIMGVLSKVMEDGEVIDSTSARWTHEAVTSIHLDMNRLSQVNQGKQYNPYEDVDIPSNIISRFDYIIDIPRDSERQSDVAYAINTGRNILNTYGKPVLEPQWERDLKRIVAFIRSGFYKVVIDSEINEYINSKVKDILDANSNPSDILTDSITRLAVSVGKYVKAIASAHLRINVTAEDVDLAFDFIIDKLNFLSSVEVVDVPIMTSRKKQRQQFIREEFGGQNVKIKDILVAVQTKFGKSAKQATVYRDVSEIGEKMEHGFYLISE